MAQYLLALRLKVTFENSARGFWTVLQVTCLEFFWSITSEAILKELSSFCKYKIFVFLLAACTNSLVDSFPYKYMSCLWLLIWSNRIWGTWYLTILLEITVPSSALDFWTVTFFKLTIRSDCLEFCFWKVDFKNHPDSVTLEKSWSLPSQSFKHNSVHMSSLNLTPNFFLNVYYTKIKHL